MPACPGKRSCGQKRGIGQLPELKQCKEAVAEIRPEHSGAVVWEGVARAPHTLYKARPGRLISGTEKHADGKGLTLAQLCEATITTSDNTAANLILSSYGGPAAFTTFARQLGDNATRLDRNEPALNVKHPDGLDTTTPRAMLRTMQKVVLGNALSAQSRQVLQRWLLDNTTGGKRLKAGLPPDWKIGDKTGTNSSDANDIGIIWPPGRGPVLVTAYLADSQASTQVRDATLAAVGRLLVDCA